MEEDEDDRDPTPQEKKDFGDFLKNYAIEQIILLDVCDELVPLGIMTQNEREALLGFGPRKG